MSYFSALYAPARTLLGDIGAIPGYSNAQIDMGIAVALMMDRSQYSEGTVDPTNGRTITPDLATNTDAFRLSLRAAIGLLQPNAGKSSYRTKVLSVSRDNGMNGQLGLLLGFLRDVIDGGFVVSSETEWDCFVRGSIAAITKLNRFPELPA